MDGENHPDDSERKFTLLGSQPNSGKGSRGPNALQGRGKKDASERTSVIYCAGDTWGAATSSE